MGKTYKDAGVNIEAGDIFVDKIKDISKNLKNNNMLGGLGGFGGAYALGAGYKDPVLVSGTDGVGTKLKLAFMLDKHDTVGIDLVAMCVNDIITSGAIPLFFLDYFATGKLSLEIGEEVIKGIAKGCELSECVLLGGETAEMPGFYQKDEYDLAGFAVGVVERDEIIDGSGISEDDIIIGIPSTGVHSNGFSLVRDVFTKKELEEYGDILIKPTRIYVKELKPLLKKDIIKGLVHITGGGLPGNIPRVIPKTLDVIIDKESFSVPEIFSLIQERGNVSTSEMFKIFNMGIGMVVIISKENVATVLDMIKDSRVIGKFQKGSGKVII